MTSSKTRSRSRGKSTKPPSLRLADPHLERERTRYEHPLPSREWVLSVLQTEGVPVEPERLLELLDIVED